MGRNYYQPREEDTIVFSHTTNQKGENKAQQDANLAAFYARQEAKKKGLIATLIGGASCALIATMLAACAANSNTSEILKEVRKDDQYKIAQQEVENLSTLEQGYANLKGTSASKTLPQFLRDKFGLSDFDINNNTFITTEAYNKEANTIYMVLRISPGVISDEGRVIAPNLGDISSAGNFAHYCMLLLFENVDSKVMEELIKTDREENWLDHNMIVRELYPTKILGEAYNSGSKLYFRGENVYESNSYFLDRSSDGYKKYYVFIEDLTGENKYALYSFDEELKSDDYIIEASRRGENYIYEATNSHVRFSTDKLNDYNRVIGFDAIADYSTLWEVKKTEDNHIEP